MYRDKTRFIVFFGQALLVSSVFFATVEISYAQGGGGQTQNVNVVNTTSNPVPTTLQGTATVNVNNTPTVNLSPTANIVQSQQSGAWNVGIAGTPTFNLAAGTSVGLSTSANGVKAEQSGAWNVGINGTPTVNLAPGTTVGINGTPNVALATGSSVLINNSLANPIPVQNVGGSSIQTTLLLNSGLVTIPNAPGLTDLGDFDASVYSKIRVVTKSNCGSANGLTFRLIVLENGQPAQTIDEFYPCNSYPGLSSTGSKIIDMPGRALRLSVFQESMFSTQQSVQVIVYGR